MRSILYDVPASQRSNVLTSGHVKILLALQDGAKTIRQLTVALGISAKSTNWTFTCCRKLRRLGLIDWPPRKGGAIHTKFRFVPVDRLHLEMAMYPANSVGDLAARE